MQKQEHFNQHLMKLVFFILVFVGDCDGDDDEDLPFWKSMPGTDSLPGLSITAAPGLLGSIVL